MTHFDINSLTQKVNFYTKSCDGFGVCCLGAQLQEVNIENITSYNEENTYYKFYRL